MRYWNGTKCIFQRIDPSSRSECIFIKKFLHFSSLSVFLFYFFFFFFIQNINANQRNISQFPNRRNELRSMRCFLVSIETCLKLIRSLFDRWDDSRVWYPRSWKVGKLFNARDRLSELCPVVQEPLFMLTNAERFAYGGGSRVIFHEIEIEGQWERLESLSLVPGRRIWY